MAEHAAGSFELSTQGQIVIARLIGDWDVPTTVAYFEQLKSLILTVNYAPWGLMTDVQNWGVACPEAYKQDAEFVQWLSAKGLKYKAVLTHTQTPFSVKKAYVPGFDLEEIHIFNQETEAINWLLSKGIKGAS